MLVLALRKGKKVMIGDLISIEVVELDGGQVKLGFEAPRDVTIDRLEVWELKRDRQARWRQAGLPGPAGEGAA